MKAAVLTRPEHIEIRDVPAPRPRPDEILVAPAYAGVCGSDEHVYRGEFGPRIHFPLIPAHEFAGEVIEAGAEATGFAPGDRVAVDPILPCHRCAACLDGRLSGCQKLRLYGIDLDGALAERIAVKATNAFLLARETDMRHAATVEPYAIATHVARRAVVEPADVVVVIGAGKIGLCVLDVILRTAALQVVAVDVRPHRLRLAARLGAHTTIDARAADPVDEVMRLTRGRGADRVIEVVGHAARAMTDEAPVSQAVRMVRNAGRVVVVGQGPDASPILWKPVVWKEAEVITSRVTLGEFPRAIAMMERGLLHPDLLITHTLPLDRVAEAYGVSQDAGADSVKVLVRVGG